jgi:hypothetical protein
MLLDITYILKLGLDIRIFCLQGVLKLCLDICIFCLQGREGLSVCVNIERNFRGSRRGFDILKRFNIGIVTTNRHDC